MTNRTPVVALTIAGSDSGGGAGIQADLKTFARFGVFGTSVITAVTAQNTLGVRAWERVSPALVAAQIDAVAEDLRPAAIKSGMLGDAEVVAAVAAGVRRHALAPYVLDPVMAATSGDALLTPDAIEAIVRELFPLATLVTPNLDEVGLLLPERPTDVAGMERAARAGRSARGAGRPREGGTPGGRRAGGRAVRRDRDAPIRALPRRDDEHPWDGVHAFSGDRGSDGARGSARAGGRAGTRVRASRDRQRTRARRWTRAAESFRVTSRRHTDQVSLV
jgi:hypothetical protein